MFRKRNKESVPVKANENKINEQTSKELALAVEENLVLRNTLEEVCSKIGANNEQIASRSSQMTVEITDQDKYLEQVEKDLGQVSEQSDECIGIIEATYAITQQAAEELEQDLGTYINNLTDDMKCMKSSMTEMFTIIEELLKENRELSRSLESIKEIARKTKLLAINAKIESARVGEAGKGFTVVADEVQNLSQQSEKSSKDIEERLKNSEKSSEKVQSYLQENINKFNTTTELIGQTQNIFQGTLCVLEDISSEMSNLEKNIHKNDKSIEEVVDKVKVVASKSLHNRENAMGICEISMEQTKHIEECTSFAQQGSIMAKEIGEKLKEIQG